MDRERNERVRELLSRWRLDRRGMLKAGAALAFASQAALLEQLAFVPRRPALAAASFSDIQFDVGRFFTQAPSTFNDGAGNVVAQFGPIFTLLVPAQLTRNPAKSDQTTLANALTTIENTYSTSPSGVMIASVSYGVPYFNRLPGGINGSLVQAHMPHLLSGRNPDGTTNVLAEAVASPTDAPSQAKDRFNVPVVIERNDVLFQFRSDSTFILNDVLTWLNGSNSLNGKQIASPAFNGLLQFQTARLQFVQPGLPRRMADQAAANNAALYEYHTRINPNSSMVMGFVDQQTDSSAPSAGVVTFVGSSHAKLTTANPGDYFDNGAIAHLSHDIDDLYQFYSLPNQDSRHPDGEPFTERCQYMFRSNQLGTPNGIPAAGNTDQFTNGGGPAFINNVFQGTNAALQGARDSAGTFTPSNATLDATFTGLPRIGHEVALQRSSRASDGTPLHVRNDGPGFDAMDVPAFQLFPGGQSVPAGSNQFKLQFLMFVPTAEFFRQLRVNVAAQDLQAQFNVQEDDNGLERFITATRRQNFLTPPRRHRAFPLLELT